LEERLVAGRHVFQSIWTMQGTSGQYRSKGGIVNVPVNGNIDVSKVWVAAQHLVRKSAYSKYNIEVDCNWMTVTEADIQESVVEEEEII
ncbi:hypothetical protein ABG067_008668, partial [Albugo candida]